VKLVFLCSPNNPSGDLVPMEVLDYFLEQKLLVVLDEAYVEFAPESLARRIRNHENLMVLRTFSKCFALAGLRIGYGLASQALTAKLHAIKPPFNVNVVAEAAVKASLAHAALYREQVKTLIHTREHTRKTLSAMPGCRVLPSHANFLLIELDKGNGQQVKQQLEKQGILVRYFHTPLLQHCIRVSIGTPVQMQTFTRALASCLQA
jgi:histidinol-phosphate aminotransferase